MAVENDKGDVFDLLLGISGVDVNLPNAASHTPLMLASVYGSAPCGFVSWLSVSSLLRVT